MQVKLVHKYLLNKYRLQIQGPLGKPMPLEIYGTDKSSQLRNTINQTQLQYNTASYKNNAIHFYHIITSFTTLPYLPTQSKQLAPTKSQHPTLPLTKHNIYPT